MVAGVAILGTAGVAGALIVPSPGGEEEVVQQMTTVTPGASATPETATASASSAPSPTPAPAPGETLTYTDPTYGYSFDYPSSWRVSEEGLQTGVTLYSYGADEEKGIGGIPDDKLKAVFWVAEGVDKPLEQWLTEGDNSPGQIAPPTVLSQSETVLGGRQALVRVIESEGLKYISHYVALGAGRVFVVNGGNPDSQVWPRFEPVLDSIRFAP